VKISSFMLLSLLVVSPTVVAQEPPRFQIVPTYAAYESKLGYWMYSAYLIDGVNGQLLQCSVSVSAVIPIPKLWSVHCGTSVLPNQPDMKHVRGESATVLSMRPAQGFSYSAPPAAIWLVNVDSGVVTFCFTNKSCESTKATP